MCSPSETVKKEKKKKSQPPSHWVWLGREGGGLVQRPFFARVGKVLTSIWAEWDMVQQSLPSPTPSPSHNSSPLSASCEITFSLLRAGAEELAIQYVQIKSIFTSRTEYSSRTHILLGTPDSPAAA